jgi:hypothetical protein
MNQTAEAIQLPIPTGHDKRIGEILEHTLPIAKKDPAGRFCYTLSQKGRDTLKLTTDSISWKHCNGEDAKLYTDGRAKLGSRWVPAVEVLRSELVSRGVIDEEADPETIVEAFDRTLRDGYGPQGVVPDYPEIRPLKSSLRPVPTLLPDLIPDTLSGYCQDIAERMQAPIEFVALPMIAALGSVAGHAICVQAKRLDPDYRATPNLYIGIVGRPGTLKSPSLTAALSPLQALEDEAGKEYSKALEDYERDTALLEEVKKNQSKAREKSLKGVQSLEAARRMVPELGVEETLEEPIRRRYTAHDVTHQALFSIVQKSAPNGVLVIKDELSTLLRELDREENAEGRGFYLTGWNGSTKHRVDRIGRGLNHEIPKLTLSVVGTIQPSRLEPVLGGARGGNPSNDGLAQRFLWVYPDQPKDAWRNLDREPYTKAREDAERTFRAVNELANRHREQPLVVMLDDHALDTFLEWRAQIENEIRQEEHPEYLEAVVSKMRKHVLSFALISWLADDKREASISKRHIVKALGWYSFLLEHAKRCYEIAADPARTIALGLVKRIERGELSGTFTAREVWRKGWGGIIGGEAGEDALQILVDHGYLIEHRRSKGLGGRPTVDYQVSPKAPLKQGVRS